MDWKGLLENEISGRNIMLKGKELEESEVIELGDMWEYKGSGNKLVGSELIGF